VNETTPVKGYRKLTEGELDLINEGKDLAIQVGAYIDRLMACQGSDGSMPAAPAPPVDKRWVSIGKTQIQQGFMAVIRGIAKPETF